MSTHKKRARRRLVGMAVRLIVFVGLPSVCAGVYYGFYASETYTTEARFAVRSNANVGTATALGQILGSQGVSTTSEDTAIIRNYVRSTDALRTLQEDFDLRGHYTDADLDYLSRLSPKADFETFHKKYRDMVTVQRTGSSGVVTLQVSAFDRETSAHIARALLDRSESLVNRISDKIRSDAVEAAQAQVEEARDKVIDVRQKLAEFQETNDVVDPQRRSEGAFSLVTSLRQKLMEVKAQLAEARGVYEPDSIKIETLKRRKELLQRQISEQKKKIAGIEEASGGQADMAELMRAYEPLRSRLELARERYASALASLEKASTEARRKQRYVVTFVEPDPQTVTKGPDVLLATGKFAGVTLLAYFLLGQIVANIRDHAKV